MRSKRILSLSLALSMAFTVAITGCSSKSQTSSGSAAQASSNTPQASEKKDDGKQITLKFAHNLPVKHPYHIGFEKIAEEVNKKSNGRLTIKVYPSEQLGKEKDYIDTLANDSGDMGTSGPGEIARRYKPALIFDAPYVFRDMDHLLKVANGAVGKEMWDELAQKTNLRNLTTMYYGQRHITTSKVAIKSPDDAKGLKLRVPDQPMALAYGKAFGAKPTPMALGEVYLALQQGVVDGQENPLPTIISNKFNEVQKNLTLSGHVTAAVSIYISEKKFKALPDDLRKILVDTVNAVSPEISKAIADQEKTQIDELKKQGINIITPDIEAFKKATAPIIKEYEDQWGKGLYEKIQAVK